MTITDDHWLAEATRVPLEGGALMNVRRFLVIHFTAGATAMSSILFWRTPDAKGASAHLVIDRDGKIYQCRPFNRTCGHAGPPGKSKWKDPRTGRLFDGLNGCSIGIELANGGDNAALIEKWSDLPPVKARHKHGGPVTEWEAYPAAQLSACEAVSRALVARYKLDDVAGHEDVSKGRKTDPGPAFPMKELRAACGFTATLPP